jgi:hypothetical protein
LGKVLGEHLNATDTWYDIEAKIVTDGDGIWIIVNTDTVYAGSWSNDSGTVGLVAHDGSGDKYWGPLTVVSNVEPKGANLAYDDFIADSVVDIAPYTPYYWKSDLAFTVELKTNKDTSGFVLVKGDTPYKNSLGYREGVKLDTGVARFLPETKLTWRDYEFRGTLAKPSGSVYDSVEVGVIFYADSSGKNFYKLACEGDGNGSNKFVLSGGGLTPQVIEIGSTVNLDAGDSVNFAVRVSTHDIVYGAGEDDVYKDSIIWIGAKVWKIYNPEDAEPYPGEFPNLVKDDSPYRLKEGPAGVYFKKHTVSGISQSPIKWRNISITKGIFKPGDIIEILEELVFNKSSDEVFRIMINGNISVENTVLEDQETNPPVSGQLSFEKSNDPKMWTAFLDNKYNIRLKDDLYERTTPSGNGVVIRNNENQILFEIDENGNLIIKGTIK